MADGELAAVFKGLAEDADQAAGNIAESIARVSEKTADMEDANLASTLENETRTAKSFSDLTGDGVPPEDIKPTGGSGAGPGDEPSGVGGGQPSEGNGNCQTGGTDPVDVVSGQMITTATDVTLPGLLPLVLRRAYASSYVGGRLFGPGWSGTLDQRVVIDADGIRYYGDDAQILTYPTPATAAPVFPTEGARWPLVWDRDAKVIRIEDPARGWSWHFDVGDRAVGAHPLTLLTDRNGHRITYRHENGIPVEVAHNAGYRVAVDRAPDVDVPRIGRLRVLDDTGDTTVLTFGYDAGGRLTDVTDASGVPYAYEYDDADRIVSRTDRNGWRYAYEYDAAGRVARGIGQDGYLSTTFDYDVLGRTTTITSGLGHTITYRYDRNHHVTETVDGLGNVTLTEYDAYGNLLTSTDPLGNVTTYTRDEYGDPIVVETPDGARVSVRYAACRMPARVENPDGTVWRHEYDTRGNLLSTTDPLGAVISYGYDQRGHLTRVTDALGGMWSFESNDAGRPTVMTNPAGAVTRYEYDGFGRVVTMIAPGGGVHRFGWNAQGKQAWEVDPTGARREMAYDAQGNLVSSRNETGGVTTFEVGPFDRLAARTDPDGARYTFDYDVPLRLTGVRNPAGARWSYDYDPAGNLAAETDFAGRTVTYRFDAAGRQIGRTDASGAAIDVERDPVGRIVRQWAGGSVTEFRYDAAGRLVHANGDGVRLDYVRDPLGRVVAETVDGLTVTSAYDALGRRSQRTTPHGVASAWGYTAAGWESSLAGTGGNLTFEYDGSGRETSRLLGAGAVLTQAFDQLGRLAEQHVWRYPDADGEEAGTGGSVQFRAYTYRPDGPVREIRDRLRGDLGYELTPGGRVTAVHAATWQERYRYDLAGNLTETAPGTDHDDAGPLAFDGALPRAAGRAGFDYDAAGRLVRVVRRTLSGQRRVWTYTWNALNRLVGVSTPDATWRYVYDPLGRRIAKRRIGQDGAVADEIRFVWDGTELAEQRRVDSAVVTVTTWDYRSGARRPLAQTTRSWLADAPQQVIDTRFHAIVTDLVGAPTELVTPDGRIAWRRTGSLWGLTLGVAATDRTDCPLRFPGQYHDAETGLHYNYFRYYDPATGRYLTPDPLGLQPAPNQYGYVRNPVVASDPLGLAGTRDPATGRFTRDPNAPPILHNRDTEYPSGYRQSTHDEMAKNWTDEGIAQGQVPVDANGVRIPRDQLTWRDGDGNIVPADQLTYEHLDPVVEHWNSTGYDANRAARNDWYNDPNNMEPMTRSDNSSGGGQMTSRYRQDVGPNYSCS